MNSPSHPLTLSPSHPLALSNLRIAGICACVPKNAVPNEAKVAEATGIRTRRIAAEGTSVVDLCVKAAERVLADTGAKPEDFGAVLCVSFTQRDRMPAAAVQAQARLGFPKGIIAFDVSLACSGWGYGLYLAGLLARETGKKVLLLDGDVQSAFTDGNAATEPLLADGGTATVVENLNTEAQRRGEEWTFAFVADGEKGEALKLSHGGTIRMDGFGVFKFVATDVVAYIKEFLIDLSTSKRLNFSLSRISPTPTWCGSWRRAWGLRRRGRRFRAKSSAIFHPPPFR